MDMLANGFVGVVAFDGGRRVGVMCGQTIGGVGFVPAHGLAVESDRADPTAIVVHLFAELAPVLLDDGASRFTIDHVDLDPLGAALNNLGFGRASVFATQVPRPIGTPPPVDVRIATPDDLDAIAALSQIELTHRSAPPIYAPSQPRSLGETRVLHERLFDDGAVHFLARRDGDDVGLLTVEFSSPAPRLCPSGPAIHRTHRDPSQGAQPGHREHTRPCRVGLGQVSRSRHGFGRLRLRQPALPTVLARAWLPADRLPAPAGDRRPPPASRCLAPAASSITSSTMDFDRAVVHPLDPAPLPPSSPTVP